MKALWTNDIHLEFLDNRGRRLFLRKLAGSDAECALIAGDIGQAPSLVAYLEEIEAVLQRPIYFALGNHDYYRGSIAETSASIRDLVKRSRWLRWVSDLPAIQLTAGTALVGHDGWGDGRLGDYHSSMVELSDFLYIKEVTGLSKSERLQRIGALGDEAAQHLTEVLPEALASDHVVVLTHVPPWAEAAWHEGGHSGPEWLPFFSCKAVGEVLRATMLSHPNKEMTVLCGHTHGGGVSQILPNLVVYTGAARYGHPVAQGVFDWG